MNIAGIIKASLIDYPGKASAVFFFGGCNFRCGYCHNPEIVNCIHSIMEMEEVFEFLQKRRRFLDAVCISGGEPTLQKELYSFIVQVKKMGYLIKLDTNGTDSNILKKLVAENLLDYVAMDVKAPLKRYDEIVCVKSDKEEICRSIDFLLSNAVAYEFRTTVCKELLSFKDLLVMSEELKGAKIWYLQTFQKQGELLNEKATFSAYSEEEMKGFAKRLNETMKRNLYPMGTNIKGEFTCVNVR